MKALKSSLNNYMLFQDRQDAGQKLAKLLTEFQNQKNTIVLGLPRGGIIVANEVAKNLKLPLDIIVARKISAPGHEEYAIGATTETGQTIYNEQAIKSLQVKTKYPKQITSQEIKEAQRRLKIYRLNKQPLNLKGKTVIIIDDGIATGLTIRAAIKSARNKKAAIIMVAVPVAAKDSLSALKNEADKVYCLYTPRSFSAVGSFYNNFNQTTDQEVIKTISAANKK